MEKTERRSSEEIEEQCRNFCPEEYLRAFPLDEESEMPGDARLDESRPYTGEIVDMVRHLSDEEYQRVKPVINHTAERFMHDHGKSVQEDIFSWDFDGLKNHEDFRSAVMKDLKANGLDELCEKSMQLDKIYDEAIKELSEINAEKTLPLQWRGGFDWEHEEYDELDFPADDKSDREHLTEIMKRKIREQVLENNGYDKKEAHEVLMSLNSEALPKVTEILDQDASMYAGDRIAMIRTEVKIVNLSIEQKKDRDGIRLEWNRYGIPKETTERLIEWAGEDVSKLKTATFRASQKAVDEWNRLKGNIKEVRTDGGKTVYEAPKTLLSAARKIWEKRERTKGRSPEEMIPGYKQLCTTYRFQCSKEKRAEEVLGTALGGDKAPFIIQNALYRQITAKHLAKEVETLVRTMDKDRGMASRRQKGVER